jgi:hypothetical protein
MTIIRAGATQKYANGWDQAFGKSDKKMQGASSAGKSGVKSKVKSAVKQSTVVKKKKKPGRRVNKVARKK